MARTFSYLRWVSALTRLLTLVLVFKIPHHECYPHKRSLNSMPQVIHILSDGLREEVKQTALLTNITTKYTSESSFSRMIDLLENQSQNLVNMTVTQYQHTGEQAKQIRLLENITITQHMQAQQIRLLENITITQHMQAQQIRLLENIAVSFQKLSSSFPLTPHDCSDVASQGPYRSGAYTITPWDEQGPFKVYCDMDMHGTEGGGWIVIQRRFDGSVDFYRGWEDYKNGFGDIDGEMWLGLEKINRLTSVKDGGSWLLRVELTDFDDNTAYAQFDDFVVGDESTNFTLTSIGQYEGTAGNALEYHLSKPFTTKDRDNAIETNCAQLCSGAWWHGNCYHSSLNGPYLTSAMRTHSAIVWDKWKFYTALKAAEMKIKLIK